MVLGFVPTAQSEHDIVYNFTEMYIVFYLNNNVPWFRKL